MTPVRAEEVRAHVLHTLAQPLAQAGIAAADAPDDLDLLDSGVIDSFGILELVSEVEDHFGVEIDFDALDPDELTVLGSFASFVATQVNASRQP